MTNLLDKIIIEMDCYCLLTTEGFYFNAEKQHRHQNKFSLQCILVSYRRRHFSVNFDRHSKKTVSLGKFLQNSHIFILLASFEGVSSKLL